jgi:hypothetical protein
MTTIAFAPNSQNAPPFQALVTLDGNSYNLVAMWNLYRGDWYISLTDQSGNLIVNQPLIGSPPDADILLAPGIFQTSTLLYRVASQQFEVSVPVVVAAGPNLAQAGPSGAFSTLPITRRGLGFGYSVL